MNAGTINLFINPNLLTIMKKFFSLLCATLLVFSASAAPVAPKAQLVKKAPAAVEQMQNVQFEQAQTLNLNQLSATPALTVSNQKAEAPAVLGKKVVKADHNATPAVSAAPAKAPKAVMADSTVTATVWQYDDYYYDVYVANEETTYLFELLESTGGLTYGTTYKYADMYADWVCTLDGEGYPLVKATDATLTVTKDEAGLIHIAATMILNGVNHIISYDEKPFEPSGVQIPLNGTDLTGKYNSYYNFYLYTAKVGNNTVQLAFDATAEQATYTKDQLLTDYCVYYSPDYSTYVEFVKAASDFTVNTTEKTKTLTGSLYADNGDEYVLNLVYEKPDAKYIDINVNHANLTNKSVAGFWTIDGQTDDKNNSFNIYFISKALQGTWTDVKKFDSYSTWVSDKSSGSNVYYENLSEVNLVSVIDDDSLKITGTMSLADNNGNPAIVTVYITTPFTQTWGEWADFAPFDKNTGKYTFATFGAYTQTGIQVQERKDNTGLKQYKLKSWSKGYFDGVGQDLILNMNPDYTFTFASNPINLGADVYFADVATAYNNPDYASFNSYDPETGVFSFYTAVVFASNGSVYTAAKESLVMDKPITERDTVDIVSTALKFNDLIASNKVVIYYAFDVPNYYLFRVTSNNPTSVDGTFKWSDGTINDPNSYFSVSGTDKNYFQDGEFTVVTNNKDIALTGWMIGTDEKYYRLNMSYTAPTERDTVYFNGKGVTISECTDSQSGVQTGWFYQLADASTGYEFLIQSTVVAEKYGTFSYADKTLGKNYYNVFDPQGNKQQFVEGSITVSNDGSEIVLDGELIAEDEKVYVLHFTQSASVLNYDTDAPFDATFAYSDMSADLDEGVIGIYATNAEGLTIGLELYTDPANTTIPAGTYAISDSEEAGTALQSLGVYGGYLTECWAGVRTSSGISDCWFMVEGTITLSYDEYGKLKVVVDAKNSYGQPVTALIAYEKIEPKKTVDFTDAEVYVYDGYVEKYGIMNFYGGNADGYEFDLYAYADTIAGDFLEAIDFGDCELTAPNGASVGVIDAYEFKVERDGKNLTLTAKVLGSDTVQYNITATGYLGYIGGDAIDAYRGEFAIEEIAAQQVAISKVNYIYIQGLNAAGDKFALVVEGEMEDEAIAAGEYTKVMASTGYDAQEQLNPSFVTDADNNDWFIQSGKLTVAENGSMVFEGVNSYDASVVINVTVPAPEVTDYYLVGWINNAAYGIEGDIDNFGDYHFVDGKVKATFNELSYVQVKDNNKQIYGTAAYVAPADNGSATLVANGAEKVAINGGVEYEYTLVVNEDGTLTLNYEVVKTALDNINAGKKASKAIKNGMIVIEKDGKAYNVLGIAL